MLNRHNIAFTLQNILRYLSLDTMCSLSSKFSQALFAFGADNVCRQYIHVSEVIVMLNAGYFFNLDVFIYVNQAFGFVTNYSLFLAAVSIIIFISTIFFQACQETKSYRKNKRWGFISS